MADTGLLEGTGNDAGLTFTEGDLLAALEAAMKGADEGPADAFTVADLARLTGRPAPQIRKALGTLKAGGWLQVVHVKRMRLDDRAVLTAAYRWRANPVEFDGDRNAPG